MSEKVKQVIVMRKDLNMRKGKMVAQGAHASMAAVINYGGYELYEDGVEHLCVQINGPMGEWLKGKFTKVCLGVDSEEELLKIVAQADEAGLHCALIKDAGLTEFNGVPTLTCAAIGPDYSEEIDKITSHLKLL